MTLDEAIEAGEEYAHKHWLTVTVYGLIGHEDYGWVLEAATELPEGWRVSVRPAVMAHDGWHVLPAPRTREPWRAWFRQAGGR